jgi:hypothetical protein
VALVKQCTAYNSYNLQNYKAVLYWPLLHVSLITLHAYSLPDE